MKFYLVAILCMTALLGCQNSSSSQPDETTQGESSLIISEKLSPEAFEKKLAETPGAQLIDLRTDPEVSRGMIPNAVQIDFRGADLEEKLHLLDKNKPTFIYCHSGKRSSRCADMMEEMGFTEIYDMKGGFGTWARESRPSVNPE